MLPPTITNTPRKSRFYVWVFRYHPNYFHLYDAKTKTVYAKDYSIPIERVGGSETTVFNNPGWLPISDEDGLRVLIGGRQYAKETYERQ